LGTVWGGYRMLFRPYLLTLLLTPLPTLQRPWELYNRKHCNAFIYYRQFTYQISDRYHFPSHWLHTRTQRWPRSRIFGRKREANGNCECNDGRGNGDRNFKTNVITTADICPSQVSCCVGTHYGYSSFVGVLSTVRDPQCNR
jgi:hypothetical protein